MKQEPTETVSRPWQESPDFSPGSGSQKDLEVVPHLTIGDAQYYGVALPKGHRGACAKIKNQLKKYVASGEWARDFKQELPSISDADLNWENDFQPTATQIDTYSCRNKIT